MFKKFSLILFTFFALIFLSGCLTVEKKEYTFVLNDNHSGTLTIKFINILSLKDDGNDVSKTDFEDLINNYIDGHEIDDDYSTAIIRSKRLFEEDGVLCGEVIIDFDNLADVGLYQYDNKSPYMFNVGSFLDSENYLKSNGEFGGDIMPVVFWPKSLKSFNLTTFVNEPDETTLSLLDEYKNWQ